ncbi:EscU/YscU/HrcU family type III secretion system export apparatus switch protein [Stigmatella sp. ncwal1]|uniref:EscU/YscU/HrcU family type III secretion system export apparatus switch protein n=1 Tax=Stigmatella ashevillensis TaxID=2995309 RepID=A0ABT5D7L5_9BACT|nr:EscU/YscU/HrcU family type III secretion system export apparatus switch protein [Stigmatella ashevillena]MDC0709658.1 EscU/YscU/HrcU family type III secretion system export apparatus switch protein [Stigmatella ashevillena]
MPVSKSEKPTAKRLRDARRKGQIPRSRLLSSSVTALGGVMGFTAFAPEGFERLRQWTVHLMRGPGTLDGWEEGLWLAVRLSGPALGGALVAALSVSLAVAGVGLNLEHVAPQLERISPLAGLKRLLSIRSGVEGMKALLVAAVLAALVWEEVREAGPEALRGVRVGGSEGMVHLLGRLEPLLLRLLTCLLLLGVADYALARARHFKDLRMSREEVKREYQEREGDPRHKAQRKALHRQLSLGGPARGVRKASAVVINPTHIAVALRYDTEECEAPYLVAKAHEGEALALRHEAQRRGIPVVRDVPLARSLIAYDVGEQIPEELYQAAAAVLRVAMEERERA